MPGALCCIYASPRTLSQSMENSPNSVLRYSVVLYSYMRQHLDSLIQQGYMSPFPL